MFIEKSLLYFPIINRHLLRILYKVGLMEKRCLLNLGKCFIIHLILNDFACIHI